MGLTANRPVPMGCLFNSCYRSGSLSLSQRRSIIFLVFKKGFSLNAYNWRLNVDYKLASRAIAGCLLKVIHLVVNKPKHVGSLGGSLVRVLPFFETWWTSPHRVMSLWLSSPWIGKRPLIGWISVSCALLCLK